MSDTVRKILRCRSLVSVDDTQCKWQVGHFRDAKKLRRKWDGM